MAQFLVPTSFRPEIGIAEIPVYYRGKNIALGTLLKDGTFIYHLTDSDLLAMLHTGGAHIVVSETSGHFFAEIRLEKVNSLTSTG